jgi:hypothetical protein
MPGRIAEALAGALIVTVTFVADVGDTEAGLNEHVARAGNPEHAKLTAELNPFCGVIVSVAVPCPPGFTVTDAGATLNANVGGGRLIV